MIRLLLSLASFCHPDYNIVVISSDYVMVVIIEDYVFEVNRALMVKHWNLELHF
jgi:hypothetical protein